MVLRLRVPCCEVSRKVKTDVTRRPSIVDAMRNERERNLAAAEATSSGRTIALRSFLFLTIVMMPLLAVTIVGGYGFLVWMYQIVVGPPSA